ncbi:uncharacterized protein LOC123474619 [Daphnia magna]|uniref:uncharacterized protein LOC123474619 n=1 Tax=Daphnia magna TaxID=35525 RepID=UPI001E1BD865|nr:uncharacterized protein LOC123474619 [Daphnia magna]
MIPFFFVSVRLYNIDFTAGFLSVVPMGWMRFLSSSYSLWLQERSKMGFMLSLRASIPWRSIPYSLPKIVVVFFNLLILNREFSHLSNKGLDSRINLRVWVVPVHCLRCHKDDWFWICDCYSATSVFIKKAWRKIWPPDACNWLRKPARRQLIKDMKGKNQQKMKPSEELSQNAKETGQNASAKRQEPQESAKDTTQQGKELIQETGSKLIRTK